MGSVTKSTGCSSREQWFGSQCPLTWWLTTVCKSRPRAADTPSGLCWHQECWWCSDPMHIKGYVLLPSEPIVVCCVFKILQCRFLSREGSFRGKKLSRLCRCSLVLVGFFPLLNSPALPMCRQNKTQQVGAPPRMRLVNTVQHDQVTLTSAMPGLTASIEKDVLFRYYSL